jgi:integrase
MRQLLTATKVEAISRKPESTMSSDGGGLYFRKRKNSASWVIRRTRNKVSTFTTIGRYPEVSLAAARGMLSKFESNPVADKTVADLLDDWYEQNRTAWRRPEQMAGYIRRLTDDDRQLVSRNIHLVDLAQVRGSLKTYAKKHGNVAANRLMEILKQVFRHAVQVGYLRYSPITELTRKVVGGTESPRKRVLTDAEIRLIWSADRHTALFRFLLLTGQRIRETQLARWKDVDGERWFIPAVNNKAGRDHWVALSNQSVSLLNSRGSRYGKIFGDVSATAVQAYLRRWCTRQKIGDNNREERHRGAFTPHDLRRTFATRLNELSIGPHIVEKILNHRLTGVMAVYNHAEYEAERATAMQSWAVELERIIDLC